MKKTGGSTPGDSSGAESQEGTAHGTTRRELLRRSAYLAGGAALLAACGPGSGPTTGVPTATSGGRKRGGTLTIGHVGGPGSFDPNQGFLGNYPVYHTLYGQLIRYDPQGKPQPWLAEKWAIAADGKSITLDLRKGVKFHSGREMTADDVVKNFRRTMDPDRGLTLTSQARAIEDVSAPEKYKVVVRYKTISASMLDLLDRLPIVDPEDLNSLKGRGSGNGAFKFVEWLPDDHWTAERFVDYWRAPLPFVDKVVVKAFRDSAAMTAALRSGVVDVLLFVPAADVPGLRGQFDVLVTPPQGVLGLHLSAKTPGPFLKKEARQAMLYAIDRKGIAETVFFGLATPTALPWGTDSPAFDPTALSKYSFDLAKAKDLLTKANALNERAELVVSSNFPDRVAVATVISGDLKKIGFTLDIKVLDQTAWLSRVVSGDYQATMAVTENHSKFPTAIQSSSIFRLQNPAAWTTLPTAYVEGMNEADSTLDPVKQKAAFDKIRNVLLDEAWNPSIIYVNFAFASAKYVKGLTASIDAFPVLEEVSLER